MGARYPGFGLGEKVEVKVHTDLVQRQCALLTQHHRIAPSSITTGSLLSLILPSYAPLWPSFFSHIPYMLEFLTLIFLVLYFYVLFLGDHISYHISMFSKSISLDQRSNLYFHSLLNILTQMSVKHIDSMCPHLNLLSSPQTWVLLLFAPHLG